MTIDGAIKTLESILTFVKPGDPPDEHNAIQLGIEALKRIKADRFIAFPYVVNPLLGETAEQ